MPKTLACVRNILFALLLIISKASGQPKITAFSPGSGPAGTPVTISGSGFQPTAASNVVYFGAVKAVVTGASATSLTVTAPVGATYQPLSVLNTVTGLTGFSPLPYVTTFTSAFGAGIPPNFYKPKIDVPTEYTPNDFVFGDIDGDGKSDMVLGTVSGLAVLRNITPTGSLTRSSFAAEVDFSPGLNPSTVAIGDLDGDGKLDIVAASDNKVFIYRNKAVPGSFTSASLEQPVSFAAGNTPIAVAIGDLDGDGKPDLAVVNSGETTISVLRNTATAGSITASSFAPRTTVNVGRIYRSIAIADLDGDKKPEITVAGLYLSVLRNLSTPGALSASSFAAGVDFAIGTGVQFVSAGDLDGDGKADLVGTGDLYDSVYLLRNTATAGSITPASFAARVAFAVGSQPSYNALADLNGDGKPDIVTANEGDNTISVLGNISTSGSITAASFSPNVDFLTGLPPGPLSIGDLDADAIPEIAVLNKNYKNISFFKSSPPPAVAVPVITDFSPVSGPVDTIITISGFNFNPVPANNTVYMGAVRAAVTGGSTTRLTIRVPAGATYRPITVLNTANGLTGYTTGSFITTFSNPYKDVIPAGFYRTQASLATGTLPYALAAGDLDGDGKPDLVTVNASTNTLSILRNVSATGNITNASFAPKVDLATGTDPRAIAIGDIDGDGKLDIVVTNIRSATVSVYRNLSSPGSITASSFAPRIDFATGANPFSVAIGDLNRDGKPDLAVANLTDGTVSVLRNTATAGSITLSSFAARINYITSNNAGATPRSVAIGDLDGDGKPEIVVANEKYNSPGSHGTVTVLHNTVPDTGEIDATSFNERLENATDAGSNCVAIGDLDGDGKPDLAVSNYGSNNITLLRNNFTPGVFDYYSLAYGFNFSTDAQPFFVAIADADGDGRPDLISANAGPGTVTLLRNTYKDNTDPFDNGFTEEDFEQKQSFSTGAYPVYVAAGDLDGDGTAELATANGGGNSVSILKIMLPGVPEITGFSPASGPAGTTVTITGTTFNQVPGSNVVYFGSVKATVTGGTTTSLTVTAPAGATYQPLSVLNTSNGLSGYASKPFRLTFANPFGSGIPANFYQPRIDVAIASAPTYAVAFGDMDGDGKSDMVAVNQLAGTVSVLRNISTTGMLSAASFAARVDFAVGSDPRVVAVSDIDGDGKLDIVVGNSSAYSISVLRNTASPGSITSASFAARVAFPTGTYLSSLAAGDLDNDGKPDLVSTNPYSGKISIWRNLSTPGSITTASFAPKVDFTATAFPRAVVLHDINGDGKAEIIVADEHAQAISVYLNQTTFGSILPTSFSLRLDYPAGINPSSIAAGDVDGDGKPDIAVANYGSGTVSVLRNITTGPDVTQISFALKVDFATGAAPFHVIMGDADGDGKTDLLTANANANTISVLRNTAVADTLTTSSFAPKADFTTSGYPLYLAMGDLDGDGVAEVAAATAATGAISVFRVNNMAATASPLSAGIQALVPAETAIQLYPNPTSGEFTLHLAQTGAPLSSLEIVNEKGMLVEKRALSGADKNASGILRFHLRNQPAGVYYVRVIGMMGVQVVKVVVQR